MVAVERHCSGVGGLVVICHVCTLSIPFSVVDSFDARGVCIGVVVVRK
jgi:hypothetical protein